MIELVPSDHDDPEFLRLAQQIVNGAIASLRVSELYLIHIDSWFDYKWLGWWSSWGEKEIKELCVPPFNPNRVCSQKHYNWDERSSRWAHDGQGTPLHLRQPGRRARFKRPLDRLAKSAGFVWYSGNTTTNRAGSMMLYLSGAEGYAWYAAFKKKEHWMVDEECQITRRELVSFMECGRQMELVRA